MKKLILIILSLFTFKANALVSSLQNGDVVLISLKCYSCRMIETEEGGNYSHSGVIMKTQNEVFVAQALGTVHLEPFEKFMQRARVGTEIAFFRPKEFQIMPPTEKSFFDTFQTVFAGMPFDPLYLWDNFDERGREKYYCSEFVTKFLNFFLQEKILPSPMDFRDNWSYWYEFYEGEVPQGALGNSPVSLAQDSKLKFLGFINK